MNSSIPGVTIAADRDWIETVRQSLPAARRVLASLRPTWELDGVHCIDPDFLQAASISGLVWDIDGTLTHRHACEPAPETLASFEKLLATERLRHVILSNCGEERFMQLGEIFPAVPVIKGYASSAGPVFRTLHRGIEQWTATPVGVVRPIRKPDPLLVRHAMHVLGITDASAVAVVGDQYLTDIAAANIAGVRSIKVPTVGPSSFPLSVRVLQRVDRWMYLLTSRAG